MIHMLLHTIRFIEFQYTDDHSTVEIATRMIEKDNSKNVVESSRFLDSEEKTSSIKKEKKNIIKAWHRKRIFFKNFK